MVENTVSAIKALSRYDVLLEKAFVQVAFASILELHMTFGRKLTELAMAWHSINRLLN